MVYVRLVISQRSHNLLGMRTIDYKLFLLILKNYLIGQNSDVEKVNIMAFKNKSSTYFK